MADDGENFTLQTDWGAMVVFGFEAFAADFCKGMTGERSVSTNTLSSFPPSPLPCSVPFKLSILTDGKLPGLEEMIWI